MNQVILKVSGGIVDPIRIPKETEIVIRDYDIVEANDIPQEIIQKDENGDRFIEIIFGDYET